MDRIILKNMKFFAYHGVREDERQNGQNFYLDVEMHADLSKAGASDDLNDTVNYGEVYEIVKNIVLNNKFRLIEKLADSISREILSRYDKIHRVTVFVRKPEAPIEGDFDWAGVEITRCRNDK